MSISLADALQQVELEVGRLYQCEIGSLSVEVRVEARDARPLPAPFNPSDVMLDPWTDFPAPQPITIVTATPAAPMLPDPPIFMDENFPQ